MFNHEVHARPLNVASFASHPDAAVVARQRLEAAGLEILQVTPFTINFAGTPDAIERAFKSKIVEKEVKVPNLSDTVTFLDVADRTSRVPGLLSTLETPFVDSIEGVALEVPRVLFAANPSPPTVDYWHLDVPDDVAIHCNARVLHQYGVTGKGVKVAMVDSGWYRHPFFTSQNYTVAPVVLGPGASEPDADESGHGTGESANIMAVAPECQLLPVKMNFVNTIGAFNAAVALQPDIITCSWGSHTPFALSAADMVLETSVAAAVAAGIIVIFSAGNGHCGFPGQHPDVISAGGAYIDENGFIQAANYASGFQSPIYAGRRVPDVCGLVGMRPKAIYIMLPVEPGDQIDVGNGVAPFPDGDETPADDGWAAFSGTSAAAPQLAGVAALIKQIVPNVTPSGVKAALTASARDVDAGFCSAVPDVHGGLPALPGPDDATGSGLVDAFGAALSAYIASLSGAFNSATPQAQYWQGLAAYYAWVAEALGPTAPDSAEVLPHDREWLREPCGVVLTLGGVREGRVSKKRKRGKKVSEHRTRRRELSMTDEAPSEGARPQPAKDAQPAKEKKEPGGPRRMSSDASAVEKPPRSAPGSRTTKYIVTVDNMTGLPLKVEKITEASVAGGEATTSTVSPASLATPFAAGTPDPSALVQAYYRGIADYLNAITSIK